MNKIIIIVNGYQKSLDPVILELMRPHHLKSTAQKENDTALFFSLSLNVSVYIMAILTLS